MDVVELSLLDGRAVFVNSARVATLEAGPEADSGETTKIVFEPDHSVHVRGDLDTVAFKLFPSSIR